MIHIGVPTKLTKRQRQPLEDLAVESGETLPTGGILDRMKDAIG
jgi:hypothetical protein